MATQSSSQPSEWGNPSVLAFAAGRDPLEVATETVRRLISEAVEHGAVGPPVDPFKLTKLLGLRLLPSNDVRDAEMSAIDDEASSGTDVLVNQPAPLAGFVPNPRQLAIAYNPTRPRGRLRFSVAHEIAHALFPDVHDAVRHRTPTGAVPPNESQTPSLHDPAQMSDDAAGNAWELELLCNVVAAELLVPAEAVEGLASTDIDIDYLMEVRRRWDVSTETLLRRIVDVSERPIVLAAASRRRGTAGLMVDYVHRSRSAREGSAAIGRGDTLPAESILWKCTAVGQTVRGALDLEDGQYGLQAVGIPGYPGALYPRILALLSDPGDVNGDGKELTHRIGDLLAIEPTGDPMVIAHVVTDGARAWGRMGFAAALARRFPAAASSFHAWAVSSEDHLKLGNAHVTEQLVGSRRVLIVSMVAQDGYGPGAVNRLRNDALRSALASAADTAAAVKGAVHVPRIGAGQAGGRWDLVEADLKEQVLGRGIPVTVYTLPSKARGR